MQYVNTFVLEQNGMSSHVMRVGTFANRERSIFQASAKEESDGVTPGSRNNFVVVIPVL